MGGVRKPTSSLKEGYFIVVRINRLPPRHQTTVLRHPYHFAHPSCHPNQPSHSPLPVIEYMSIRRHNLCNGLTSKRP